MIIVIQRAENVMNGLFVDFIIHLFHSLLYVSFVRMARRNVDCHLFLALLFDRLVRDVDLDWISLERGRLRVRGHLVAGFFVGEPRMRCVRLLVDLDVRSRLALVVDCIAKCGGTLNCLNGRHLAV